MENPAELTVVASDTVVNLDILTADVRYPILHAVKMISDGIPACIATQAG